MKNWNLINIRKKLPWVIVIIWMALIFYLSHHPATKSNDLSTGITGTIIKTVEKVAPGVEFNLESFNHIIRKNAHFFAYLVLGILVVNALKGRGVCVYRNIVLALVICILYAVSDEVHQLFVPGRGAQLKDVMIDSAGAIVGLVFHRVTCKIKKP